LQIIISFDGQCQPYFLNLFESWKKLKTLTQSSQTRPRQNACLPIHRAGTHPGGQGRFGGLATEACRRCCLNSLMVSWLPYQKLVLIANKRNNYKGARNSGEKHKTI
jgi:hypothetical protein